MSGTAVSHGAVDDKPVNTAHEIAEQQGCPTANVVTMVRCLQKVSAQNIIKVCKNWIIFLRVQNKNIYDLVVLQRKRYFLIFVDTKYSGIYTQNSL